MTIDAESVAGVQFPAGLDRYLVVDSNGPAAREVLGLAAGIG